MARTAKGSHEIWRRDRDGKHTTIPNHGSKDISRRTLKAIIEDFDIDTTELHKILEQI